MKAPALLFISLLAGSSGVSGRGLDGTALTTFSTSETFFLRALMPPGSPLEINISNLPDNVTFPVKLEKYDGTFLSNHEVGPKLPLDTTGLSPGLYRMIVPDGGFWEKPLFGIGTFSQLHHEMAARCAAVTADDRTSINLQTLVRRLEILDAADKANPKHPPSDRNEYKAVYAAAALEDILNWLAKGQEPFRDRPGVHLRGFRSAIDDQVLHYRIFVPSSYERGGVGLPLVIIPPPVFVANRPFLESAFVARLHDAEQSIRAAEALGVGILWPGYRVRPYGNPVDFAHYEEVLAAVRADYQLDPHRIYLQGYCSGGLFAAMEALRHPHRYAGIAFVNPVLHRLKGRFDEREEFKTAPLYGSWLRETDPLEPLAALPDIPIHILYDGFDPDHGLLSESVEYVERARALGGSPRFDYYRTAPISRAQLMGRQLEWLVQQRRPNVNVTESAIASRPSSIAQIFGERFLVVEGTADNQQEKTAGDRWLAEFKKAWQDTSYTDCRITKDSALTDSEEKASNLVLVGNATTNAAWRRLMEHIPLLLARDEIRIGKKSWSGKNLAVQAWIPHPSHPDRKIVCIGAYDLNGAAVGTMELALDGWFDYAIWDHSGPKPLLVFAGRYERNDAGGILFPR